MLDVCEVGELVHCVLLRTVRHFTHKSPAMFDLPKKEKHYFNVASLFSAVTAMSDIIPADNTYHVNEK